MFHPSNDAIGFTTNGTEKMRIDTNGNVGIGTSNLAFRLDVSGKARIQAPSSSNILSIQTNNNSINEVAGIMLGIPSGQAATIESITQAGGVTDLRFWTTGSNLTITSNLTMYLSGNSNSVGIGNSNPTERLQVSGKIYSDTQFLNNSNDTATAPSFSFKEDSNTGMFHASNDAVGIATGGSERMRINSSGNVGIGVENPAKGKLEVAGVISSFTTGEARYHLFNNGGVCEYKFGQKSASSHNFIISKVISGVETDYLTIDTSGNVGIGTTSPTERLQVSGKIYSDTQFLNNSNDTATAPSFSFKEDSNTGMFHPADDAIGFTTGGTERFRINNVGGTISGSLVVSGDATIGDMLIKSYNKSLGTTALNFTNICTLTSLHGSLIAHLDVVHNEANSSESKSYIIPLQFVGSITSYYTLLPIASSGEYLGNDWSVEINPNSNVATLRLVRLSGSSSSANFTCTLRIFQSTVNKVTIGDSSTTGTSATNIGIFESTQLTQLNGNVGIGMTTPQYKLDVSGDINLTGTFRQNGTPYTGSQWSNNSSNVFLSGSNVGIGTSTPTTKLHVYDASSASTLIESSTAKTQVWAHSDGKSYIQTSNDLFFGQIGAITNPRMYITSTGRLGINTIAPSERLHVSSGKIYSDTQILGNSNDNVTTPSFSFLEDSNTGMYHPSNDTLGFVAGGVEAFRVSPGNMSITSNLIVGSNITANGNLTMNNRLIISTLKINRKLGIDANVTSTSVRGFSNVSTGIILDVGSNAPASGQSMRVTWSNNTELMRITGDGNVGIGTASPSTRLHVSGDIFATGNVTAYSDLRIKTNLEVISNPIEKVSQLTGYTYEMIEDPDLSTKITTRFTGVIAQDLEKVLPEAVHKHNDGKYSVAYGNMAGLFVEAIKELTSENKELKNKVKTLEERLERLEALIG
jgi:hypothetical protein